MSDEGPAQAATLFAHDLVFTDCARGLTLSGRDETVGWLAEWKTAFSDAAVTEATYLESGDWTTPRTWRQRRTDGWVARYRQAARSALL